MTTPNETVFGRIYDEHRAAVHAYFFGRTGDRALAADLVQETFLRVWRNFDDVAALTGDRRRAWIFTVARNLVIDSYRTATTRAATQRALDLQAGIPVDDPDRPDLRVESADRLAAVGAAIATLPEPQRVALTMQAAGGLNSSEIGAALGEPAATIRYRLATARRTLTDALTQKA